MLKVFITDDDDIIRQGLRVIVEKYVPDCQVVGEAADGELALEGISSQAVDLLITDIKMPVMDGITLIKRMRELDISTKVIVLSGFDEYKYVRDALRSGAVDYLLKPIQKNVLVELIEKVKEDIKNSLKIENNNKLQQIKANEMLSLLKEKYLINLIKGNYSIIQEYEGKLNEAGISKDEGFVLAVVAIDNYFRLKGPNVENLEQLPSDLLKNCMQNIIEEKYKQYKTLIALQESQITVMFAGNCQEIEFIENVSDMFYTLRTIFKEKYNYTVSSGVSKYFQSLDRTHIACHQATFAMERRFYEGNDTVTVYEASKCAYNRVNDRNLEEQIKEIISHIELGYSKKVRTAVQDLFKVMVEDNIDPFQFKESIRHVVLRILSMSNEFWDAMNECFENDEHDIFYYIKEISTFSELQEYTSDMFYNVTEKINLIRAVKSKKIIEIAKDYILKHYNENLSLNVLAEQVYLNPSYFSNVFKNETGKNFTEFLLEVRINAAKKLLAKPEIMIYEVGQMVGYEEPVSFGRAFKKIVGVSPAEYRKIIK